MVISGDSIIKFVRITKILVEKSWTFIDNGYNYIEYAINEDSGEKVIFDSQMEFVDWLYKKCEDYLV